MYDHRSVHRHECIQEEALRRVTQRETDLKNSKAGMKIR